MFAEVHRIFASECVHVAQNETDRPFFTGLNDSIAMQETFDSSMSTVGFFGSSRTSDHPTLYQQTQGFLAAVPGFLGDVFRPKRYTHLGSILRL